MSDNKTVSGKVTGVQSAGTYVGKTGRNQGKTVYKFEIELDNGSKGQLSCLTEELNGTEAPVAIGQTHEFNVYASQNPQFLDSWYLRKPKAEGGGWKGGGKGWTPDPNRETAMERWAKQRLIVRQSSYGVAVNVMGALQTEPTFQALRDLAHAIEEDVYRGIDVAKLVKPAVTSDPPAEYKPAPKPAPKPAAPHIVGEDEDHLPF